MKTSLSYTAGVAVVASALFFAALASPATATHPASAPLPGANISQLPQPVTDVTTYGAVGDGVTDSGVAVRNALTAAQAVGGTLYFPAGHYLLSATSSGGAFSVVKGLPMTIAGDSSATTIITALTAGAPLLAIRGDHTTVQDLTLDAQSHDLGDALYLVANYATIQRCSLLGGSHFFGIYAAGDAGNNVNGNTGNQLLDDLVNDHTQLPLGDGISWSFQHNSTITNLNHTGSRLALYEDTNVTVTNDTYHPGPYTSADQGFWISAPSDSITIDNFTSYGNGGRISANHGLYDTNVTINNEQMLGTGAQLRVDGAQGLIIDGCNLGTTNSLAFAATVPLSGVVVKNCTSLPTTSFWDTTTVGVEFDNDSFPASTTVTGTPRATFVKVGRLNLPAPVAITIVGGTWANPAGGLSKGNPITWSITGLLGY